MVRQQQVSSVSSEALSEETLPTFLRKKPSVSKLYFDANDEAVDEVTALNDQGNYYHKYHFVECMFGSPEEDEDAERLMMLEDLMRGAKQSKSHSKMAQLPGYKAEKVTKDIFDKETPDGNTEVFLKSLERTRKNHQKRTQEKEMFINAGIQQSSFEMDEQTSPMEESVKKVQQYLAKHGGEEGDEEREEGLLMDLNPEKYEKPKDYLFFDFYSLYAKNTL
jgi:hypothetical protein